MQTTQHTAIKPCSPDPSAPANGTRERPHRLSRRRCPSRRGAARGRVPQVLGHPGARRGAFGRRNHPAHVDAVPGWICGHGAGQKGEIAVAPDHPVTEGPDPLDVGGENVTQRRPVTSRQAHEERSDDLDDLVLRQRLGRQRFFQFGARFSAKARGPSLASSLLKTSPEISDSIR